MASLTRTAAALAAAALLTFAGSGWAQNATQADFDACNRMAQAASPGSSLSVGPGAAGGVGGTGATSPGGADANRQINSNGRISSSAGSPGTNSGTTGSSAGAPSASPRMSATDPRLNGMAATGHVSEAYQQAYRDCMKQRGF